MEPADFQQLLAATKELMPLSDAQEIFLVVSSALSTLAFELFDWRAVLHFLAVRENRDRLLEAMKTGKPVGTRAPLSKMPPPRH